MSHCDPDLIALAALGEPLDDADAQHFSGCQECQAELASLRAVVQAGAVRGPLQPPAERVWDGIAAEIEKERNEPERADDVERAPEIAPVVSMPSRHPHTRRTVLLAAASIAVGALGAVGVQSLLSDRDRPVAVASAVLEPLPGWQTSGAAVVEDGPRGPVLRVELPTDDDVDGYREVWLISTDLQRLISLGVLTSDSGTFELPPGVDLADFAVVDVSQEPVDGDPAHSGVSIVRGELV